MATIYEASAPVSRTDYTHDIITKTTSQMGVTMQLEGTDYWMTTLQDLVEDADIDQETADLWEKEYDGYKMIWTFSEPQITVADDNIDAACIKGAETVSNGGFCCGIKYVGNFSSQPEIWAVWFTE